MHALQGGSVAREFVLANIQLNEYKITVFLQWQHCYNCLDGGRGSVG